MKRVLIWFGALVLALVVVAAVIVATTFMGRKGIEDGFERGGVRVVADGFVSVGVIDAGDGKVALIDAGNDASGEAILRELARRNVGPDAVTTIFLTHGHPDHRAAIAKFPAAIVMALAAEIPLIEGRVAARGPVTRWSGAEPTGITVGRALQDGDVVTVGNKPVRVFAISGHTAGSAAYLVDEVLFLGDSGDTTSDGTLRPAVWLFSDDQSVNRASLASLADRVKRAGATVRAIVPAHSGPMTDGLAQLEAFAALRP